jgi:hypothetical protein
MNMAKKKSFVDLRLCFIVYGIFSCLLDPKPSFLACQADKLRFVKQFSLQICITTEILRQLLDKIVVQNTALFQMYRFDTSTNILCLGEKNCV